MRARHLSLKPCEHAFSLPEVMICVAIIAIMLSFALPRLAPLQETEGRRVLTEFSTVLQTARSAAVRAGEAVRICPTGEAEECGNDWRDGVVLLFERDDSSRRVIARHIWDGLQGTLSWRAFGNRQYLIVDRYGLLDHQNGTLLWCGPTGSEQEAASLVINAAGRSRLVSDTVDTRCQR